MLRKCFISILTFWCLNLSAQAGDSSVLEGRISIAFSNVTLNTALRQLNRQANIRFSYNSTIIPRTEKIISSYRQETLRQILEDLLSGTNLYFKEVQGRVVINKEVSTNRKLRGIVVDGENGDPLPFTNVFIDNSTLGVATDTDGTFELNNLPDRSFDLVTSYVGYDPKMFSLRMDTISQDEILRIEIFESPKQVGGVTIKPVTKRELRLGRKLLKKFETEFLGRSDNSKKCRIMNPQVLEVKRIGGSDDFVVTASDELIVENRALGYRVRYQLEEFIFENGAQTTTGTARFQELKPKSRKQNRIWEEARRKAYYGSLPHFLNSLIEDNIKDQGFEVNIVQYDSVTSEYQTIHNPPAVNEILKLEKDGNDDRYQMTAASDIEITYTKEGEDQDYIKQFRSRTKSGNYKYTDIKSRSRIEAGNKILQVIIDTDEILYQKSVILFKNRKPQIKFPGTFSNDEDALYLGYWNWGGLSEKLPLFYKPRY